jgi:hypothetical protein
MLRNLKLRSKMLPCFLGFNLLVSPGIFVGEYDVLQADPGV